MIVYGNSQRTLLKRSLTLVQALSPQTKKCDRNRSGALRYSSPRRRHKGKHVMPDDLHDVRNPGQ